MAAGRCRARPMRCAKSITIRASQEGQHEAPPYWTCICGSRDSWGRSGGSTGLSLRINYAPEQSGTGDQDNFYVFGSFSHPLTNNLSLNGLVGYEDGAFGNEKINYSLGLSTTAAGLGISVSYVGFDADGADDDTVVATVGKSF